MTLKDYNLEELTAYEMSIYNTEAVTEEEALIYASWGITVIYNLTNKKYYKYA